MQTEATYEAWLLTRLPIAGADGEEDPEADPADPPADPEADPASGEEDPEADLADPEEDPEDDPEDEDARRDAELKDLRERLAKAETAAKNAKNDARKAREDAAKKGGNWEQVAQERESELADVKEQLQTVTTRAVDAEEKLDNFQREVRVTRIATRLHFRDPQDAINALKPEQTGDDKTAERALRQLAKDKDYLVDQKRARGRSMDGGGGNGNGLTLDDLKKMPQEQIQQLYRDGKLAGPLAAAARRGS